MGSEQVRPPGGGGIAPQSGRVTAVPTCDRDRGLPGARPRGDRERGGGRRGREARRAAHSSVCPPNRQSRSSKLGGSRTPLLTLAVGGVGLDAPAGSIWPPPPPSGPLAALLAGPRATGPCGGSRGSPPADRQADTANGAISAIDGWVNGPAGGGGGGGAVNRSQDELRPMGASQALAIGKWNNLPLRAGWAGSEMPLRSLGEDPMPPLGPPLRRPPRIFVCRPGQHDVDHPRGSMALTSSFQAGRLRRRRQRPLARPRPEPMVSGLARKRGEGDGWAAD